MAEDDREQKEKGEKQKRTGQAAPGQATQETPRSLSEAARFAMRIREMKTALFDAKEGKASRALAVWGKTLTGCRHLD